MKTALTWRDNGRSGQSIPTPCLRETGNVNKILFVITTVLFVVIAADNLPAQDNTSGGVQLVGEGISQWEVGVTISAVGNCRGLVASIPVFTDWPEQQVQIVEENFSKHVKNVQFRVLGGGVKQMIVSIPYIGPGETAQALVTYEITRQAIESPRDTSMLKSPKKVSRSMKRFLGNSPYIETSNSRIRAASRHLGQDATNDWKKVEAIYDWVRDNVQYEFSTKLKGAAAALKDGKGDCEEMTSLFVAMCRLKKIPARCIWVPGHCYPEFYLQDSDGHGHWFPCQVAGQRDFGSMPDLRPIIQKGDSFKVPGKKKPQRYVSELLKGQSFVGGKPKVRWVRKMQSQ